MCQRADWFISDNAGMIENFLKFPCGGGGILRCEISPAPKIDRIERTGEVLVRVSQLIRGGCGEGVEGDLRNPAIDRERRSSHRQISRLNNTGLRRTRR